MSKTDKFWLDDINALFASFDIVPRHDQSFNEKLNSLTRLSAVVSILLALFSPITGVCVMFVSFVVITTAYFSTTEETKPKTEYFTEQADFDCLPVSIGQSDQKLFMNCGGFTRCTNDNNVFLPDKSFTNVKRFCDDDNMLRYDDSFVSVNQMLVGGPNPKTYVPPIVAAPSHDLSQWRTTDLVTHSHINDETNFDAYRSGYIGNYYDGGRLEYSGYYNDDSGGEPQLCKQCYYAPCKCPPRLKSKLETITTQTLQPGVYQQTLLDEPINSNIGISFQKQFDPMMITTGDADGSGRGVKYTTLTDTSTIDMRELSPITCNGEGARCSRRFNIYKRDFEECDTCDDNEPVTMADLLKQSRKPKTDYFQSESNVFDPRFTGYGSNDRFYLDKMTGQPRFFYDDIDAIKMPNYIARTNVDVFPWASQYGQDVGVQQYGDGYKQLANNAFLQSTLKFRTEMQERLMRKRNAEMWQKRVAPVY